MIIYDSSVKKLLSLSSTELRVLMYFSSIGKNNIVDTSKIVYNDIGISKKTVQNSVSSLIKDKILYRTDIVGVLYIEPMFMVVGNLKKCLKNGVCIRKDKDGCS